MIGRRSFRCNRSPLASPFPQHLWNLVLLTRNLGRCVGHQHHSLSWGFSEFLQYYEQLWIPVYIDSMPSQYKPFPLEACLAMPELIRLVQYWRCLDISPSAQILPSGVVITGTVDTARRAQPGVIYHSSQGGLIPMIFLGRCLDDDDDDDDSSYGSSLRGVTLEMLHRIAAPSIPHSAKMVEYSDQEREKGVHSKINGWLDGFAQP